MNKQRGNINQKQLNYKFELMLLLACNKSPLCRIKRE